MILIMGLFNRRDAEGAERFNREGARTRGNARILLCVLCAFVGNLTARKR